MASRIDVRCSTDDASKLSKKEGGGLGRRKLLGVLIDNHHNENHISDKKLNLDKLVSEKIVVGERSMMIEKTKSQMKREKKRASKARKKLALLKQQQQPEEERPSSSCSSLRKRIKNQKRKQQRKAKKRAQALVDKEKKEDRLTESSKPIPSAGSHDLNSPQKLSAELVEFLKSSGPGFRAPSSSRTYTIEEKEALLTNWNFIPYASDQSGCGEALKKAESGPLRPVGIRTRLTRYLKSKLFASGYLRYGEDRLSRQALIMFRKRIFEDPYLIKGSDDDYDYYDYDDWFPLHSYNLR